MMTKKQITFLKVGDLVGHYFNSGGSFNAGIITGSIIAKIMYEIYWFKTGKKTIYRKDYIEQKFFLLSPPKNIEQIEQDKKE